MDGAANQNEATSLCRTSGTFKNVIDKYFLELRGEEAGTSFQFFLGGAKF